MLNIIYSLLYPLNVMFDCQQKHLVVVALYQNHGLHVTKRKIYTTDVEFQIHFPIFRLTWTCWS